ncbi:MAG: hypothetical protein HOH98_01900 [Flavobacteriaceae bacterium]|nr:hypothetical protein [Flavobacteriaceae bacterium]
MEKVEKEVYTNKELRDTLESYNLNDDTIDLIKINLYFKESATYEPDYYYINLDYKSYKYEVRGFLVEKHNDVELFYHVGDDYEEKSFDSIALFLEKIQDKEIGILEDYLDFTVNGARDSWYPMNTLTGDTLSRNYPLNEHLKPIEWIDETPEEIKDEFEKKFRDNNYRDVIYEGEEAMTDGFWEFFDKNNNISGIYFNINSKGTNYDIRWINKKI